MKAAYTKATLALLTGGKDVEMVLSGLRRTLRAHGHSALLPGILRAALREIEESKEGTLPRVTVAKTGTEQSFKTKIAEALAELRAGDEFITHVDETIVGGFIAEHNHTIIDRSYKSALVSLYRNIAQ